jgi:regulator of RNase E activity RraA
MTKELFAGLSAPTVSDALDKLGIPGACLGIAPLFNEAATCGPAFTVRYQPVGVDGGTVGDFIDDVPEGAVVVIDNAGRTDCTVWGDIMTTLAVAKGIGGTVIDGVCRDVARPLADGYPMFTCGRFMLTGKDRVACVEVGGTVSVGGINVRKDDIMLGDANGVVVIPREHVEEVAKIAREIDAREEAIIADIQSGTTLRDARAKHGYHTLQTKGA